MIGPGSDKNLWLMEIASWLLISSQEAAKIFLHQTVGHWREMPKSFVGPLSALDRGHPKWIDFATCFGLSLSVINLLFLHKAYNWYVGRSHNVVFESTLAKRLSAALRLLAANWMFVQDDPVLQEYCGTLLLHLLHCFLFFIFLQRWWIGQKLPAWW